MDRCALEGLVELGERNLKLEIDGLSKSYGDKKVFQDFSCSFQQGITGILGPNGAGKSTLMNLITDNVKRDSGRILYGDKDVLELGKVFRSVLGYMPQEQGMYDDFSALVFLRYMAELKGLRKKEVMPQIDSLLELVALKHVSHRKLGTYSGGMKQRILLCQALLGSPEVIILDEPTAGLDVEERIKITEFIKKLSKGRIVLWSTHIVSDIEHTASNILIMRSGENLVYAPVEQLIQEKSSKDLSEAYLKYMNTPLRGEA